MGGPSPLPGRARRGERQLLISQVRDTMSYPSLTGVTLELWSHRPRAWRGHSSVLRPPSLHRAGHSLQKDKHTRTGAGWCSKPLCPSLPGITFLLVEPVAVGTCPWQSPEPSGFSSCCSFDQPFSTGAAVGKELDFGLALEKYLAQEEPLKPHVVQVPAPTA